MWKNPDSQKNNGIKVLEDIPAYEICDGDWFVQVYRVQLTGCDEKTKSYYTYAVFYNDLKDLPNGLTAVYGLNKMGVMALEMEAAALYMNAARSGKRGLCICTISDHVLKGVETTAQERQNSFTTMMKVALDVAVAMENK